MIWSSHIQHNNAPEHQSSDKEHWKYSLLITTHHNSVEKVASRFLMVKSAVRAMMSDSYECCRTLIIDFGTLLIGYVDDDWGSVPTLWWLPIITSRSLSVGDHLVSATGNVLITDDWLLICDDGFQSLLVCSALMNLWWSATYPDLQQWAGVLMVGFLQSSEDWLQNTNNLLNITW